MPASLHHHTPSLIALDPRGLTVRSVAYYRQSTHDVPQARISRQVFGSRGVLQEHWDPRLNALRETDTSVRPNQRLRYSLSGQLLLSDNVDQGRRLTWLGAAGQVLNSWDARGACQAFEYDQLLRVTRIYEQASDDVSRALVEHLTYAASSPHDAASNACGRLINHDDPAGTLLFGAYDVLGQLKSQTRRFSDETANSAGHTTTWRYQATGQLSEQTDAQGNIQHWRYTLDGLLASAGVTLKDRTFQAVIEQRVYNASGQVQSELAGNGVIRELEYSPWNDRLQRLRSLRSNRPDEALQDLTYTYDRVGNVVSIRDAAQAVQWHANTQTEALSTYRYDSLSQLIEATGRESAQPSSGPGLPQPLLFGSTQPHLSRQYRQRYTYDAAGNLLSLQHAPVNATGYTRHMTVGRQSNHSLQQIDAPEPSRGFDQNGNQQALGPGQAMVWNVRNQLQRVTQVVRSDGDNDDEVYCYDSNGQRALKVRRSSTKSQTHHSEVRYLPGLEIRRNTATGEWLNCVTVAGELSSVRILQWIQGRPSTIDDAQFRYGLADHLGSSTLELDARARVLSQESYYPYGGTAWWAMKNAVEAAYKTVRYSGKERDASGLYYYGYRYYAPWLCRWVSADPAGDIDGLNLYAMAHGNPVSQADSQGLAAPGTVSRVGWFGALRNNLGLIINRVRPVFQAASSAGIRDALSTYTSNAIGAAVDYVLFEGRQPTRTMNNVLRNTVAVLDAAVALYMTSGFVGNWTRLSPLLGLAAMSAADQGFAGRAGSEAGDSEQQWDPVARMRLFGHVRAFSREIAQQVVRGLGTSISWGQTPLGSRLPGTLLAAGAYGLATVPNAMFGPAIPGTLAPNIGPLIEAYDAGAATLIRAGHAGTVHEPHVDAMQLPNLSNAVHGGLSRMFNQVWGYWAGVGIESLATLATGSPSTAQSARARLWVGVARGVASALTELRGLVVLKVRSGFMNLRRAWTSHTT
ncbi:RHS repeat domain-containing protein [Pseudomonas psychrophila]|uniref:RHS repeat domain-containing protein n=1 Tax=Pseudomonas psychrophila TaxID=122355 RepID=UPI000365F4AF|nr:RHS repeat-associated core domain-containing protein [Pseudomonas psychrophila]